MQTTTCITCIMISDSKETDYDDIDINRKTVYMPLRVCYKCSSSSQYIK